MRDILKTIAADAKHWTELRVHDRRALQIMVRKETLETAAYRKTCGVGVRVLVNGTWGFSSTGSLERLDIERAVRDATASAEASSAGRLEKIERLADCKLAVGDFISGNAAELATHSTEEKAALVIDAEKRTREASDRIRSATSRYTELIDEKWIVSTDGADAHIEDAKAEFVIMATAASGDDMVMSYKGAGVTGGWPELFARWTPEELSGRVAKTAVDLLDAPYAPGGRSTVVLAPDLVGLLAHEAIGHTVEADFILSGSAAAGKMGEKVASEHVTLVDSGPAYVGSESAGGVVLVDDEGVPTGKTVVIENGVLTSYLHDRESAARFGVAPTGNARAWLYRDEPIIRMRNTYLEPANGDAKTRDELVAGIDDGFLLKGANSGQADATAEFMFGVQEAYEIKKGKLGRLMRGATISGDAFEVLKSVDAVSSDFEWAIGTGHCGKGQPAKVDGGGPYVRCELTIGGR